MSFDWSAGDISKAITLVGKIISCVKNVGGSRGHHFQESVGELHGLELALSDVALLTKKSPPVPEDQALALPLVHLQLQHLAVTQARAMTVETAAATLDSLSCTCRDTLERFYQKIKPFEDSFVQAQQTYDHSNIMMQQLNSEAMAIREKVSLIPTTNTGPTLENLVNTTANIWVSHSNLIGVLVALAEKMPPSNLEFTWDQAPVKFEAALGRIIPIPSEYDWNNVYAVIQAQFTTGPGSAIVHSEEFNSFI